MGPSHSSWARRHFWDWDDLQQNVNHVPNEWSQSSRNKQKTKVRLAATCLCGFQYKGHYVRLFPGLYVLRVLSDCERQNERIPRGEEWIQHTVCLPLPFFDLFFGISQLAPWYASCSSNIRSRTMCTPAKPLAIREWINKMKRNGWVCVREGDGAISHGLCSIPQDTGGK